MRHLYILTTMLAVMLTACTGSGTTTEEGPFRGYWSATETNDDGDGGSCLHIRLDFYDRTVCADGFENVLGVMSISEDMAVYTPVTADLIKEVEIVGANEARIKYVQQESGSLWSGTLKYHPSSRALTFENGERLSSDSLPEVKPYAVDPSKIEFAFVSDRPNYKVIPPYNILLKLPDRVYYRNVVADESIAPPFGDVQLRCYFPETDRDVLITNEVGMSPLGSNYRATIIDCWALPEEPGLMLIIWTGGRQYQESTLYRVDESNKFVDVDYVIGRRPARYDADDKPDPADISKMVRNGKQVRVYDPRTRETRIYDLSGRRI
ncbi:MAG: hypothetical protein JFR38_04855 [Muribaculaceae bacterium]|nr:hypothetical protein [Muribaculaceae bacterium]